MTSRAEQRLIDHMTKRGGKGFRLLRSPETTIKTYRRVRDRVIDEDGAGA